MKINNNDKILKLVKDSYNNLASDFKQTRKKEIWPKLKQLGNELKDNAYVLDLACGNGRLIEALANKKIHYLGLDNSEKLIKIAQDNYPNFDFKVADMLNFKVGQKYDYIFCIAALQHIPSKKLRLKVLKNIKEALAPKGRVIIANWNMWQSVHRVTLFSLFIKKIIGLNKLAKNDIIFPWKNSQGETLSNRYYHAFFKRELLALGKEAGYLSVNIENDKYNYWLYLEN